MAGSIGYILFIIAPGILGAVYLWLRSGRKPSFPGRSAGHRAGKSSALLRQVRAVVLYLLLMSAVIYGALRFVGYIASATVPLGEVFVVL